ncbi:MAG: insulinase family protein [Nitrospirae bacterium]|nr:insulinase family protein [Nitrospirota bacterium]
MKKIFSIILLLLLLSLAACAHTSARQAGRYDGLLYEEVLPNGLKVFALKDPNAPLAVFQIWYNAGSIHEQVGKTGLSHLLEHLMFKGTPKYGPKEFSKIISRAGGVDNAGTSRDYVYYHQKLAPDKLYLSIELEADRMSNLVMDPKETLSERDVVMEERRMRYDDDPQNIVYEEVMATAFKNIPYRWPVIGWMEDLKRITRDDLYKYYKEHYAPNNAMIIVAGNIDVDAVMTKIRSEFGGIPKGGRIENPDIAEPEQSGEKRLYVKKEAELPYVLIGYKTPNFLNDDGYALEVLAGVLSGGKSSRIYKSLIDEKRLALSADASYSSLDKYPSLFFLDAAPLPGKSIDEVEKALYEEVEKIKKEAPDEKEVQKAKNQVEAGFIMGQDSIFFQAEVVAMFEMLGDRKLKDKYFEGIRKVTPQDVQRAAQKYLVEDKKTVGVLVPLKKVESGN